MMGALGRCGILYRPHSFRLLGPARSSLTPICSIEAPRVLYQNGSTVGTVTVPHPRHFSASGWHNSGGPRAHRARRKQHTQRKKIAEGAESGKAIGVPKELRPKTLRSTTMRRKFKWASAGMHEDDVNYLLESHLLDSSLRASERFPVIPEMLDSDTQTKIPATLNPHNPENEAPFDSHDPLDPENPTPLKKYGALVIDCEMVGVKGGEQGLVNIAVIDFFTGGILLRSLVRPSGHITDWRKNITGYNKAKFQEAIKKGKVLSGWEEVRELILNSSNSKTIFIGHSLASDLRVLRIATDCVVDSMVMMSRAVFGDVQKFPRHWSLKTACKELLGVEVQNKRGPHSPVEDAFATRELVLQCVLQPLKLTQWAENTRAQLTQIVEKERAAEEAKLEKKKRRKAERESMTPEQRAERVAKKARELEEKILAKKAKAVAKFELKQLRLAKKRERKALQKQKEEARAQIVQERAEQRQRDHERARQAWKRAQEEQERERIGDPS